MRKEVIAIFDIGKTNKKFLLFDAELNVVYKEEKRFEEIEDEDGFPCEDIQNIEIWIHKCITNTHESGHYRIMGMNFTTYGATLMYIDKQGERITPVYNYLKPFPEGVIDGFYDKYGGIEEFTRRTASPAMGMLNSGLQTLWLKRTRPKIFVKVKSILHLPQYFSYLLTRQETSEYTSIGCHTGLWDFNNHTYHQWVYDEALPFPDPVSNYKVFNVKIDGRIIKVGIGIHDSSASLVPYLKATKSQFILISTGTWCILMNPFNKEPLTTEQLRKDTLCYMSTKQQQVKSSRLFLGYIHDINVKRISNYFNVDADYYKTVKTDNNKIISLFDDKGGRIFFKNKMPEDFVDREADLSLFSSFDTAYHKFMFDLVEVLMESLKLIIPEHDETDKVYITGGFTRNEIFMKLLARKLPDKEVYLAEIEDTTALGAAMVIYTIIFGSSNIPANTGFSEV